MRALSIGKYRSCYMFKPALQVPGYCFLLRSDSSSPQSSFSFSHFHFRPHRRNGNHGWSLEPRPACHRACSQPQERQTDLASREPTSLIDTFKTTVTKAPNNKALSIKKDGQWVTHTWQQYYDKSLQFAQALIHVGVQPHEAVNVLGDNCPEWLFTYMGIVMAGAVIAGIYGTSNAEACQYISAHCDAKVVVVSDKAQLDKYLSVRDQLPELKAMVVWNEVDAPQDTKGSVSIYSFSEFLQLSKSVDASLVD